MTRWLGADPVQAQRLGREAWQMVLDGMHPVPVREQLSGVPYAQPEEAITSKESSAGRVIAASWSHTAIIFRGWLVCLAAEALGLVRTAVSARPYGGDGRDMAFQSFEVPNNDDSIKQLIEAAFEEEGRRFLRWAPVDVFQSLLDYLSIEYGVTQGWYQREGVEDLLLHRGDDVRTGEVVKSVTSWTTRRPLVYSIASGARFWRHDTLRIYSCTVPVVRCLASWHTTPEIFHRNEYEVAVLHPNGTLDLPCSTEDVPK